MYKRHATWQGCHAEGLRQSKDTCPANLLKFCKLTCKVLHQGGGNPKHEYSLYKDGLRAALSRKA